MRALFVLFFVFLLLPSLLVSQSAPAVPVRPGQPVGHVAVVAGTAPHLLIVTVSDPSGALVAGARVELLSATGALVSVRATSAIGDAALPGVTAGKFTLRVLAAGFAEKILPLTVGDGPVPTGGERFAVQLEVANPGEVVVVSSTLLPVTESEGIGQVSSLDHDQLQLMQPTAANDAVRFLPGAVVNTAGQRGGISSLFVRGGESRYNKVLVDGVPVNEPGGTFNFGDVPLASVDRIELLRGAQSALYGSDAITSVVQLFSATGHTEAPELKLTSSGGNFGTATGNAELSQAVGRFDYNLFADEFHTHGQGANDGYSASSQGANAGVELNDWASARVRVRHNNTRTGVPSAWDFNGARLLAPDSDQYARQNTTLGSLEFLLHPGKRWQHHVSGYDYYTNRLNADSVADRGCDGISVFIDCAFRTIGDINRSGFKYQGEYTPRGWAKSVFGYEFEDENAFFDSSSAFGNSPTHGLRRNHALFGEELLAWKQLSVVLSGRYVHNESFGDKAVPRVAASYVLHQGGGTLGATRLRFAYATGIKAPRFEESFGNGGGFPTKPNNALKPEQTRSFEAGFTQSLASDKVSLSSTYFRNRFRDQIDFAFLDCAPYCGQYVNVNQALAHGVETELQGRVNSRLSWSVSHTYTSTRIESAPFAFDPLLSEGKPLLRRPHHAGTAQITYVAQKWGANVGASFVGRRPDSDFLGFGVTHAAGYALVNLGGWYAVHPNVTAFVNVENATNRQYNEVVGYPGLSANVRAGLRFRIGKGIEH